jgi:phasin family protein
MPETKRMAEEANRMGEEVRDRAQRVGHEFQKAAEGGFEAASRSLSEANRGFQAMAAEMTDFSKKRMEDVLQAWQQLLRARHFGDVVEAQTHYAQRAFDAYTSEWTKLGEMCVGMVRDASKPVEDASRKFR